LAWTIVGVLVAEDTWGNRALVLVAMVAFVFVSYWGTHAAYRRWSRSPTWKHWFWLTIGGAIAIGSVLVIRLSHDVEVRSQLGAVVAVSIALGAVAVLFSRVVGSYHTLVRRLGPIRGSPYRLLAKWVAVCVAVAVPASLALDSWHPLLAVAIFGWTAFVAVQAGVFDEDDD
jgi:hypothetical protein